MGQCNGTVSGLGSPAQERGTESTADLYWKQGVVQYSAITVLSSGCELDSGLFLGTGGITLIVL